MFIILYIKMAKCFFLLVSRSSQPSSFRISADLSSYPCGLLFWPLYFEVSEVSPLVICLSYPILRHSGRKGVLRAHYILLTMYFWEQIDWPALEPPVLTRFVYIGCQHVLEQTDRQTDKQRQRDTRRLVLKKTVFLRGRVR